MFEKVKTYTTKRVSDILSKDAENFGFLKTDGITPNKNALLSNLLINYFEIYNQDKTNKQNQIASIIKQNTTLGENSINNLAPLLLSALSKDTFEDKAEKYDQLVSLKPTKQTNGILEYINNYMLKNDSLSKYLRDLFTSYTSLPQDRREIIIFKPIYDTLMQAISQNKKVFLTPKNGRGLELSPYTIALTKEEMHLYLLGYTPNSYKTIKLSSIQSVIILDKPSLIDSSISPMLQKMQKNNPQFVYTPNTQPVVVQFTDRGLIMYRKIYLHRPTPIKVEGNIFTFDCSYTQAIYYFSKFGKEAKIIAPEYVQTQMLKFYQTALDAYVE